MRLIRRQRQHSIIGDALWFHFKKHLMGCWTASDRFLNWGPLLWNHGNTDRMVVRTVQLDRVLAWHALHTPKRKTNELHPGLVRTRTTHPSLRLQSSLSLRWEPFTDGVIDDDDPGSQNFKDPRSSQRGSGLERSRRTLRGRSLFKHIFRLENLARNDAPVKGLLWTYFAFLLFILLVAVPIQLIDGKNSSLSPFISAFAKRAAPLFLAHVHG